MINNNNNNNNNSNNNNNTNNNNNNNNNNNTWKLGKASKISGILWRSPAEDCQVFGNPGKISGDLRKSLGDLRKSSKVFGRFLELIK